MPRALALLTLPLLLACPPKATPTSDDTATSGGDDTATSTGQTTAVMTTVSMDYAVGSLATVGLNGWVTTTGLTATTGDSAVVVEGGLAYVLNRYGYDTVRVYEPGEWSVPLLEFSVGGTSEEESANPYDAAVCADLLFVSLYGRDWIGVYNVANGVLTGTVDLSAFADGDSVGPEPGAMVTRGDKLYIGMNRLNRDDGWIDTGGAVAEVDCATATVTASWDVAGNAALVEWSGEDRVLVQARAYGDMGGGLYAIDPAADTVTWLMDAADLGGEVSGVAAAGDAAIVTSLASDYSGYGIHCVDLETGEVTTAETTPQYLTTAAANDRGEAWIGAHWGWIDPESASPGVIVYDIAGCEALNPDSPIDVTLAPLDINFY